MLLYDFLFILLFIGALPLLALRRKIHSGYWQRLGFISRYPKSNSSIWLHAVSVGEILSARELLKVLKKEFPHLRIVISTITPTGNAIAKTIASTEDMVTYLPFDISFIIRRFIKHFNPCIFIALETELWPNIIVQLSRLGIPQVILNGRISVQSFKRYKMCLKLLRLLLAKIRLFAMQNSEYALRIIDLGAPADKVKITGNMKFDVQTYDDTGIDVNGLRQQLELEPYHRLFVAGCTHQGEEGIILSVYKKLKSSHSSLCLLLAPRHTNRIRELEGLVSKFGYSPVRTSSLSSAFRPSDKNVYLLDTMGELKNYYAASDIVFVGGSLLPYGGHNILEPAFFAKPILFGKFMYNFSDIRDLFISSQAAIEVKKESELEQSLEEIIGNPVRANNLGLKARDLVTSNKGATERNLALIKEVLAGYGKLSL